MKFLPFVLTLVSGASIDLWPLPKSVKMGSDDLKVSKIDIGSCGDEGGRMARAIDRFGSLIIGDGATDGADITLTCESVSTAIGVATDESYSITGTSSSVSVTSKTIYGQMYALETLSQLVTTPGTITGGSGLSISDSPSYPHRALMIDTGRRFVPLPTIKQNIDAMAANKLNVLHLHFADWCRFAIESDVFPELTEGLTGEQGGFYTKDEVREMISYANDRGVRLLPEIDLPSHSGWGFPLRDNGKILYCDDVGSGPGMRNDEDNTTLSTLNAVIKEMSDLFDDSELFHIGADETSSGNQTGCSLEDISSLENGVLRNIVDLGKIPVGWAEVLFASKGAVGLEGKAVINSWQSTGARPKDIEAAGFDAVESDSTHYYLDTHISYDDLWHNIGDDDDTSQSKKLLGGEVSMWTDAYCYIGQCGALDLPVPVGAALYPPEMNEEFGASFNGMVWPGAAVAAGSFWNYDTTITSDQVKTSIDNGVLGRMQTRGMDACPVGCTCDEVSRCGKNYIASE